MDFIGKAKSTVGQFEGMRSKEAHDTARANLIKHAARHSKVSQADRERLKEAIACHAIVKHRKEGQSAEQVLEDYVNWLHETD